MQKQLLKRSRQLADQFLEFVNFSLSPFHVVSWCRKQLTKYGYQQLQQTSNWELKKGCKYFFTRNNSTLVAFNVGTNFDPQNTGFKIVGTHTDSPCIRLAPVSKGSFKSLGISHVGTYGGGLWHTWFDRDLMLAGKIVYKKDDAYSSTLWKSKHPMLKIANLAIHLRTDRNLFDANTENHLKPILSSELHSSLLKEEEKQNSSLQKEQIANSATIFNKHDGGIIQIISKDTEISVQNIIDFDLYFADSQPSNYVGVNQDFISSPRLDNLFSSFHAIMSLMQIQNQGQFINIAALFDHEECGSDSAQGAGSSIIMQSLNRIYKLLCANQLAKDNFQKTMQRSFVISADMAHSIHPNYSDKHQTNHQVQINKGVVIKTNFNQRYATDLVSTSILRILAKQKSVPIQEFIVKNDSPCGSTIGPIIAHNTGIKTIDIGIAMLGMHSIRETCGIIDGVYYRDLFSSFYKNFQHIKHDLFNQ